MVQNMKGITWKADVERALREIGRPATASEIFEVVRRNRQTEGRQITTHSREGVRRILQNEFEVVNSSATLATTAFDRSGLRWLEIST
jgi:hypothetical protein